MTVFVVELRTKKGSLVKTSPLFADRGHAERWGIRKIESREYISQKLWYEIKEVEWNE